MFKSKVSFCVLVVVMVVAVESKIETKGAAFRRATKAEAKGTKMVRREKLTESEWEGRRSDEGADRSLRPQQPYTRSPHFLTQ